MSRNIVFETILTAQVSRLQKDQCRWTPDVNGEVRDLFLMFLSLFLCSELTALWVWSTRKKPTQVHGPSHVRSRRRNQFWQLGKKIQQHSIIYYLRWEGKIHHQFSLRLSRKMITKTWNRQKSCSMKIMNQQSFFLSWFQSKDFETVVRIFLSVCNSL